MPQPEFDCCLFSYHIVIHLSLVISGRKYAVSEALENLCRDVVDDYVDTLKESRQLLDSREPPSKIIFSILGIAVYGKKYVDAVIREPLIWQRTK